MTTRTDVLVIGAGSAGAFCALGAAACGSVVLLETGPDAGDPPPRWSLYDYLLPDEHYHRYVDADTGMALPQGRGLGGGSTVNSAAALRGQPWCYDAWSVQGWRWADVLPGLRAIEADEQFGHRGEHGDAGPIPITRLTPGPLDEAVMAWCLTQGHPATEDHNAPGALGAGMWPTNRREGGRWGTYAGVIPAARAAGVDIRTDTTALRLCFDGTRCTGAEVTGPGGPERIEASRVVLCAGAFGSPTLLLRSGVGPEDVLADLDVPPVSVLPGVGRNLADHPWCLLDVDVLDAAAIEARPVSGALLRYELPGPAGEHAEAEVFAWQARPYVPSAPATRVSFTAALMTPRSRGDFTLTPAGPRVRAAHLADELDADRIASVVATTASLVDDLAAQSAVRLPNRPWWRTDDLVAAARAQVGTYNHHSGTCRLGEADAPDTVVGPGLDVLGVQGLFVADSSVIPVIPRANTNLASMMIGWRAAGLVCQI